MQGISEQMSINTLYILHYPILKPLLMSLLATYMAIFLGMQMTKNFLSLNMVWVGSVLSNRSRFLQSGPTIKYVGQSRSTPKVIDRAWMELSVILGSVGSIWIMDAILACLLVPQVLNIDSRLCIERILNWILSSQCL